MSFVGKVCPYCKTELKEDDEVVVCSICEMPHHKECWIENKACTTFGCTGTIKGANEDVEPAIQASFCTNCGSKITPEHKFCGVCGTKVNNISTSNSYTSASTGTTNYASSNYTQPQYNVEYNQYVQQQLHADPDLYAFVETNQMFYIPKFQRMQQIASKTSWNWCSFFFTTSWFLYRKMYGIAVVVFIAAFIVELMPPALSTILGLVLYTLSGIFGNYFYKQYVDEELRVAKSMDATNKSAYIAKKGGTSTSSVVIFFVVTFVLGMFMAMV